MNGATIQTARDRKPDRFFMQTAERSLPGKEYSSIADWTQELPRTAIRNFRKGDIVAVAGASIDMFARVQRGVVSASALIADGREFIVDVFSKGALIGELEALRKQPITLEYRAASDCELHFFDGRLLREACANDQQFQVRVLTTALARIAELELRIISSAGSNLTSRLAQTLLRLAAIYGVDPQSNRTEVIISQHELAATLPASREKVNQCLRRLREGKVIGGVPGRIQILNWKALEVYAKVGGQAS
jgi:CRP/FNR family transcriptional regulator, cyclic AMP receptor protein